MNLGTETRIPQEVATAYALLSVHRWDTHPAQAVLEHIDAGWTHQFVENGDMSVLPLLRHAATSDDDTIQRAAIDYAMILISSWYDTPKINDHGWLTKWAFDHTQWHREQ